MTQRILIIGAGFAGMWSALSAARLLDQAKKEGAVEIALIAPEPVLHVRPRLYEINPTAMQAPLDDVFNAVGVNYIQGSVQHIRPEKHEVEATGPDGKSFTLSYDRLVLATGSKLVEPPIPGLKEYSFNVDTLASAGKLEQHLAALKKLPDSPARNTVVVGGGGFTGIETATEMPARLRAILGDKADVKVIIVERNSEIGPDLGPGPRPEIMEAINELGIEWRVNAAVAALDADGVTLSTGEHIPSKTVIWTAGVKASPLTAQIDAQRDNFGRLHVTPELQVKGVPTIFATGDTAYAATDDIGNHAVMSCQHAISLGRHAGHNAAADLIGHPTKPYSQPKYVTCLDLGAWGAVFTEGWHREVKLRRMEAKTLKQQINGEWIYPPRADRAEIFAAADPANLVVA
ncbi:NAD(P)/FAD-dependent oxidoreductase [Dongia soli]|uniref:NAD(P)/FAD-dependent oxidoreductase n=1 Tax=Dongia soli TaxID=600628 RepID=A0ABU5EGX9_9PROT|nr:NAD(P)/FAD-dependent oxidoreductase [Dongia soli]MDY0884750.1 NAD(P)/FAD-dependent oxidoreductase [Dongia soli]